MLDNSLKSIRSKEIETCYLCGNSGQHIYINIKDRLFNVPGVWNYKRCNQCGLVWMTPRPEDLSQIYENYYTHTQEEVSEMPLGNFIRNSVSAVAFGYDNKIDNLIKKNFAKFLSWFGPLKEIAGDSIMWLKGDQKGSLLDIGCGGGVFLAHIKSFGWDVTGIDPDPNAAQNAKTKFKLNHIVTGFVEDAGFAENSFDVITMGHVIEHLPDPIKTLKECRRILKPGGRLIVKTPNAKSLGSRIFKKEWLPLDVPRHLFVFDSKTIKTCAQKAGFRSYTINTPSTMGFYICQASLIIKKDGKLPGAIPRHPTRKLLAISLIFWLIEYFLNLIRSCGEEVLLIASKD